MRPTKSTSARRFNIVDKDDKPVTVTVYGINRAEPLVALQGGEHTPTLDSDEVEFARLLPLTPF